MFSFRYHIASLVAVFLALTVGLLLGTSVAEQGSLAKRQQAVLASIREDIAALNQKNNDLNTEIDQLRQFSQDVLKTSVRDRLKDRKVAIVTFGDKQEATTGDVTDALRKAGASVSGLDLDLNKLDFADKELVGKLSEAIGVETTTTSFEKVFWKEFAEELVGRTPPQLLDALEADSLLQVTNKEALPVDRVVLLAPLSKKSGSRDTLLIGALKEQPEVIIVGVETTAAKRSRMSAYQVSAVGTVDNIETAAGKISLVYLLETGEKGKFGAKASADRLLP